MSCPAWSVTPLVKTSDVEGLGDLALMEDKGDGHEYSLLYTASRACSRPRHRQATVCDDGYC